MKEWRCRNGQFIDLKIYDGKYYIDGVEVSRELFETVMETSKITTLESLLKPLKEA